MVGMKRIYAAFYESRSGKAPVRGWLLSLDKADRRIIGEDIATVEFGWPIGVPCAGSAAMGSAQLAHRQQDCSRAVSITGDRMVLLHGFEEDTEDSAR